MPCSSSAGDPAKFYKFAGEARTRVGHELEPHRQGPLRILLDHRLPHVRMERGREEDRLLAQSVLHAARRAGSTRSRRKNGDEALLGLKAYQYDIVCNGVELSSGAIRNHMPEIMYKAFEIAGYGPEVVDAKFGGMIRAFQFGAPPHGGIAPGIDRIVMLLCGAENLRDVTMFPMNQQAEDLLMGAPSEVSAKQLRELHIRLNLPKKDA